MAKRARTDPTPITAYVRALRPADWIGKAGDHLRRAAEAISKFAGERGLRPTDVLEESLDLGHAKLRGLAYQEYSTSVKNFADTEQKKIETALQRQTLASKIRREEAETRIAEMKVLDAEIELLRKMKEYGVILRRDVGGNLTVLPVPEECDLLELVDRITAKKVAGA
jgi:hypothetical protein